MRTIVTLAALALLSACANPTTPGGLSVPPSPQSTAQQINAHWPALTAGIALALALDGNSAAATQVLAQEKTLGPQISACAVGTDPNCTAQVQVALAAFLNGIKLGPKGTVELQAAIALVATLVPGLTPAAA